MRLQTPCNKPLKKLVVNGEVPGATIVVVDRNETIFAAVYGVAKLETGITVTDATLFEVGSIGKTLTAIVILVCEFFLRWNLL